METQSIFDTQQACRRCKQKGCSDPLDSQQIGGDAINAQQIDGDAIEIQYTTDGVVIDKRWSDLINTEGIIGGAIVFPYSTN